MIAQWHDSNDAAIHGVIDTEENPKRLQSVYASQADALAAAASAATPSSPWCWPKATRF
ncbi:hypothetical protein [Billgrantia desiderata]|uniref:hypothetical protein n=1 Tax=Billgrantia desiderata TaxID=52021 RepID=UPI0013581CD0|nr:hypothetical protein [Halomonas desiderata]